MKKCKWFSKLTALVLTVCMLAGGPGIRLLKVNADEDNELASQYVSEVKMFYADTEEEARRSCEEEGFYFCANDLKEESKSNIHAWLGYKTTDDEGDAITDLTLLDMKNSHYDEMTYEKYLDAHVKDYADLAGRYMILVNEFRSKNEAGSPNAKAAYDSLNMFYVDENKSHTAESNLLGEYLLTKADVTFFEKFIQRGNAQVLSAIANQLVMAASDFETDGTTWVDRAKTSAAMDMYETANSGQRNEYNSWYKEAAVKMIKDIRSFADIFAEASELYDQFGDTFGYAESDGITEESTIADIMERNPNCRIPEYVNALTMHAMLDGIVYQEAGETVVTDAALLYAEDEEESLAEATVIYSERMTLAEYFLALADDEDLDTHPEIMYPFVASMTVAQRTALRVGGLNTLIKGLYQLENYDSERESIKAETTQKLKDQGYEDGKIYLWSGVDTSMYGKLVVETSDSIEAKNSGDDLINSQNKAAREAASDWTIALQIIDYSLLATSGTIMVIQAMVGASLWEAGLACYCMSSIAAEAALTGTMIAWGVLGTLCCALFIISIIALVASLVYLAYTIMDSCGLFDDPDLTDYETIPDIVFHARENADGTYSVRYDAVKSNATTEYIITLYERMYGDGLSTMAVFFEPFNRYREVVSDIGAFQGLEDRWMALYYTKAPAAGSPIKVVPGESFILTQKNEYRAPEGTKPLTLISNSLAADINSIEINGKTGTPLYMFIITGSRSSGSETPEPGTSAEENEKENEEEKGQGGEIVKSDQYITRVQLAHASKKEDALNSLRKGNFLNIIEVNLTPYDGYTYLGYQYGSKKNALTDIRVSTQGTDPIVFGGSSYGRCGTREYGITPDGISLYATSSAAAGTPITRIEVRQERLEPGNSEGAEPVCLFSGGNAVDFKHKWSDNVYFIMADYAAIISRESVKIKQDDPVDGLYIYFWPEEQFKAGENKEQYVAGFSYFMAGDDNKGDYGTQMEFMQKFAKANGFELVMDGSSPLTVMTDGAAKMNPLARWRDVEGGALGYDWKYDMVHGMTYNKCNNVSDEGYGTHYHMIDIWKDEDVQTSMYFGVSYTYNPYRAITGIMGLITPYTETTSSLRFSGLQTAAGVLQPCNVSIQGNPVSQAGISYGYFNYTNMSTSLYTNDGTNQKSDLAWLSGGETEVLSRYLLVNGPTEGVKPIKRDQIKIVTSEKPGSISGYVPVCDLRTPGDYSHPMNFALDTTNKGSKYLYLYLKNDAGGRTEVDSSESAVYHKKHFVAAVYCGTGRTPEAAINDLYAKARQNWSSLVQAFPDLPETPLVSELDEIYTVDIGDDSPWYTLYKNNVKDCNPSNNHWVRGNEAAHERWGHAIYNDSFGDQNYCEARKDPDDKEHKNNCAYIGVVRTNYAEEKAVFKKTNEDGSTTSYDGIVYPVYALLKYYNDDSTAPSTLQVGSDTVLNYAGGPVKSKEGQYYLYYSTNSGTASFAAPITEIDISDEPFINGFNTSYSCMSSQRVGYRLPEYGSLRMRTDEYKYIHTKYDMDDLPYIEYLYLGIGKNRKEAYADLIGSTNASAATTVNCNYNSYSDRWIAVGYRRTKVATDAIRDVFLYVGDDPPEQIEIDGYTITTTKKQGKEVQNVKAGKITYYLMKHNLPVGAEVISLNEGGSGMNTYLYFTTKRCAYDLDINKEILPVRNMAFGYGDISPVHATAGDLAEVYKTTMYGMKIFDETAYKDPSWEYLLGIEGISPSEYKIDGSNGFPVSLNYGQLPDKDHRHTAGDKRVIMYLDHGSMVQKNGSVLKYSIRPNAELPYIGYYSANSKFGVMTQAN